MINLGVLQVILQAKDKMSATVKGVRGSIQRLDKSVKEGINKSFKSMAQRGGIVGQALASLGPAGIAAAAGMVAFGGAIALGIRHVTQLGDQITTMSAKTGVGTDFLQKLKFAAEKLDVPFESTVKAISKFQANVGKLKTTAEASDALNQLGLSVANLKNQKPEEQFNTLTTAIDKLTNQSERAAVAQALFGRAGIELLPLLNRDYRALSEQAERLGLVMSQDLLEAGDELEENFQVLKTIAVTLVAEGVGPLVIKLNELSIVWIALIQNAKDDSAALREQMDAEGQLQSLIESGLNQKEIEAKMFEIRRQAAIQYRNELQQQANAENEAFLAAQAAVAVLDSTAAARVQDAIAAKSQNAEISKLAKLVGMSVTAFTEMDAAFQAAVGAEFVAMQHAAAATAMAGLNFQMETVVSTMVDWEGKLVQASNTARQWSNITNESFASVQAASETFGVAVTGVGDIVDVESAEMAAAFQRFGLQTQAQSMATEAQMVSDLRKIKSAHGVTTTQIMAAETALAEFRKTTNDANTKIQLDGFALVAEGSTAALNALGVKGKKFSLSQAIINTALAVTKALTALPFPANLPAAIGAAAAGAVQIAVIASQPGFQQGTPGLDFQDFGPQSSEILHGREAIIPQGGGHQLAGEIIAGLGGQGGGGGITIEKVELVLAPQGSILSTEEDLAAMLEPGASMLILQSNEFRARIEDEVRKVTG